MAAQTVGTYPQSSVENGSTTGRNWAEICINFSKKNVANIVLNQQPPWPSQQSQAFQAIVEEAKQFKDDVKDVAGGVKEGMELTKQDLKAKPLVTRGKLLAWTV